MDKNLTIRIAGKKPTFQVFAETDDAASVSGTLTLPDELMDLAGMARGIGAMREVEHETPATEAATPDVRALGVKLFQNLFAGNIRDLLMEMMGSAENGVRIRLNITAEDDAAALAALPWEILTPNRTPSDPPLAFGDRTVLVRTLDVGLPTPPITFQSTLKILLIVSNPTGTAPLDLKKEQGRIEDAFGLVKIGFKIDVLETATEEAIADALANAQPAYHIVHFMGHGDFDPATGRGALLMENADESAHRMEGDQVRNLLSHAKPLPQLVFLNACKTATTSARGAINPFGGVAASLLAAGIPAVLAMQYPISDTAAIKFATLFYKRLATGVPVDDAVADARRMLYDGATTEWATPVLFLRPKHGVLFSIEAAPAPVAAPSATAATAVQSQQQTVASPPSAPTAVAADPPRSAPAAGTGISRPTPSATMVAQSASGEPPFRIFLAATAITQSFTQRMRPQLIRDLAAKGIEVLPAVPNLDTPDEFTPAGHEARVREVAANADLFVHIFNEEPGDVLDGESADGPGAPGTFPVRQLQLGAQLQKPQLVLVNEAATVATDTAYGAFLTALQSTDRERRELEFDRVRFARMAERITQRRDFQLAERARLQAEAAAAAAANATAAPTARSVYVDVHVDDLKQARPLIKYLQSKGTPVVYTDPLEDTLDAPAGAGPQAAEAQFKKWIGDSANVIFFFGAVDEQWLKARYWLAMKLKMSENLPTRLGLYVASERSNEQLQFANMSPVARGAAGLDPAAVDALLAGKIA